MQKLSFEDNISFRYRFEPKRYLNKFKAFVKESETRNVVTQVC